MSQRAGIFTLIRQIISLFHLRKDLCFTDYHAVETGRSGKKVSDRIFPIKRLQFGCNLFRVEPMVIRYKVDELLSTWAIFFVFSRGIYLNTIASRQQHCFRSRKRSPHFFQSLDNLIWLKGQLLTKCHVGMVMTAANHL